MEIFRKNFTSLSINKTVSTFLFTIYSTLTSQVQYNILTLIISIQQNNASVDKYGKITAEVIKQC